MARRRAPYPTDLSDAEWAVLEPLVPAVKPGGRPAIHQRQEIVNALAYWLRAGCAWRLLPHDLPPWQTVYYYWRRWSRRSRGLTFRRRTSAGIASTRSARTRRAPGWTRRWPSRRGRR